MKPLHIALIVLAFAAIAIATMAFADGWQFREISGVESERLNLDMGDQ